MSYRIRFTTQTGATFYWERTFATRTGATHSAQLQADSTGYTFAVEEVPDAPEKPTSTTERLVGLLRDRHARGLTKYGTTLDRADLATGEWAQHAIEEALDLAGYLMRLHDECGREPGSTAAHHVEILQERVKELEAELAEAKAHSVPVGASEAPREGGDSDRRRLEALERYLEGDTFREVWKTSMGPFAAGTKFEGQHFDAPTLAALADKLAEMEDKP